MQALPEAQAALCFALLNIARCIYRRHVASLFAAITHVHIVQMYMHASGACLQVKRC